MSASNLTEFITNALAEDVGSGDHTSMACLKAETTGSAKIQSKEAGVIAGIRIAEEIYKHLDTSIEVVVHKSDGDTVDKDDLIMVLHGPSRALLTGERLVLNCMQRMSGIATLTHKYVDALSGLQTKLLDTRKTTPGFRSLEKEAVKIGGGENHRFGLFDMIMIKDNHIDLSGGISEAVESTVDYLKVNKLDLKIEVEIRSQTELEEALSIKAIDRVLLDNHTPDQIKTAVEFINGRVETEASGGITLENIREYGEAGVDYISVGAVTHGARSLDISMTVI